MRNPKVTLNVLSFILPGDLRFSNRDHDPTQAYWNSLRPIGAKVFEKSGPKNFGWSWPEWDGMR